MIVNVVSDWGTAGVFVEPRNEDGSYWDEVDIYGVEGDFDNPERVPYNKMIFHAGCIGFPNGREWDWTAEDANRLHALGVTMIKSGNFTVNEVEGVLN